MGSSGPTAHNRWRPSCPTKIRVLSWRRGYLISVLIRLVGRALNTIFCASGYTNHWIGSIFFFAIINSIQKLLLFIAFKQHFGHTIVVQCLLSFGAQLLLKRLPMILVLLKFDNNIHEVMPSFHLLRRF